MPPNAIRRRVQPLDFDIKSDAVRQIPCDTLFTFLDWKKRGREAVTAFNLSTMLNSLRNIHSGSDFDKEKLKADLLELDRKSCKHQFQLKVIKCILCPRNKSATINCKAAKAKEREKAQSVKNENKKVVVREKGSSLQMEISSSEGGGMGVPNTIIPPHYQF